jgi:hypothetical protein
MGIWRIGHSLTLSYVLKKKFTNKGIWSLGCSITFLIFNF